ncbi:hypothetical protein ABIB99_001908 [Bradyrhizobium sp. LA6.1]|uniref:hypothetical protein n=1 Tax=Bradyrhizobium sp. LA6.1 TaxID=3156378 RepID=UPI003398BF14
MIACGGPEDLRPPPPRFVVIDGGKRALHVAAIAVCALIAALVFTLSRAAAEPMALVAPTAPISENNNRIATTAWVNSWAASAIPLASGKIWIGSVGNIATPQSLGTGVATALGVNVGTAGAPVLFNGALGTPASGNGSNLTNIPTTSLTGTLQAAQEPAHTGDCTNSVGSLALTCTSINGVNQTTAWTTYAPTPTSGGGAYTSASSSGSFKVIGKLVHFTITITITTVGSGSGTINVALPIGTTARAANASCGETALTGKGASGRIASGGSSMIIMYVDNTAPSASGVTMTCTGIYEQT